MNNDSVNFNCVGILVLFLFRFEELLCIDEVSSIVCSVQCIIQYTRFCNRMEGEDSDLPSWECIPNAPADGPAIKNTLEVGGCNAAVRCVEVPSGACRRSYGGCLVV